LLRLLVVAVVMRSNPRFARLTQLAVQRNCTYSDK
jgi:hypothetical protein